MRSVTPEFKEIESAWFIIRARFDDLSMMAPTAEARMRLLDDRDGARDAYYLALSKAFDQGDGFVRNTLKALKDANTKLQTALADITDLVAVLGLISSVAQLMAALAAMGT